MFKFYSRFSNAVFLTDVFHRDVFQIDTFLYSLQERLLYFIFFFLIIQNYERALYLYEYVSHANCVNFYMHNFFIITCFSIHKLQHLRKKKCKTTSIYLTS